ncbi:MAG: hypothetical protein J4F46_01850 [Dehalococcoidia bacterium]|nr:hypothetical protein [Dehalococcoidia bacterium]
MRLKKSQDDASTERRFRGFRVYQGYRGKARVLKAIPREFSAVIGLSWNMGLV